MHEMRTPARGAGQVPALLTIGEVAELLRVNTSTVYRWTTSGTLRAVRFSNCVRVPVDALETFVTPTIEETI